MRKKLEAVLLALVLTISSITPVYADFVVEDNDAVEEDVVWVNAEEELAEEMDLIADEQDSENLIFDDEEVILQEEGTWQDKQKSVSKDEPAETFETVDLASVVDLPMVSSGQSNTAFVKTDGSLWTTGYQYNYQWGFGATGIPYSPQKIMDDVAFVDCGEVHTAIIKQDGSLWMQGLNDWGELGDGTKDFRISAVKVMDDVAYAECGISSTAIVKTDGSLWVVGNVSGVGACDKPKKLMDGVASVSFGEDHIAILKRDGSLWMMGDGHNGELGLGIEGRYANVYEPTKLMDGVAAVSCGKWYTAILKTDGTLWMTGDNTYGQFGNGTNRNKEIKPVKVMSKVASVNTFYDGQSTAVVKTDGSLWTFGNNINGQLGIGSEDEEEVCQPQKVMENVSKASMGWGHMAVIKADGSLWTVGSNWNGQLGIDTDEDSLTPICIDHLVIITPTPTPMPIAEPNRMISDLTFSEDALTAPVDTEVSLDVKVEFKANAQKDEDLFKKAIEEIIWSSDDDTMGKVTGYEIADMDVDNLTAVVSVKVKLLSYLDLDGESHSDVTITGVLPNMKSDKCTITITKAVPVTNLKMDGGFGFTVPASIPGVGGGKVSLDFGKIPVLMEREDNTYRIGIGVENISDIDEGEWLSFKKFVETQKESYKKGINTLLASQYGKATMGMKVKPTVSVYGYAEGTITEKGVESISGNAMIEVKATAKQEWQTYCVSVPVVIKFSGEVGLKKVSSIGFDFNNQKVFLNGKTDITLPKIKLSGGVGVAYVADISVYGSATNTVTMTNSLNEEKNMDMNLSATLSGEMGVEATLLFAHYEQPLWSGKKKYYSKDKTVTLSEDTYVEPEWEVYEDNSSDWNEDVSLASEGTACLISDIYASAKPKLLRTTDGTMGLVYTGSVSNRAVGNQTVAMCASYNPIAEIWTNVRILDDDGTGDYQAKATVAGSNIVITWVNTNSVFDAEGMTTTEGMTEFAGACDIEAAIWNPTSGTIRTMTVAEGENMESMPDVYEKDGEIYFAWVENTNADMLTMSGNNIIHLAKLEGSQITEVANSSIAEPVTGLAVGTLQDDIYAAVTTGVYDADDVLTSTLYLTDAYGAVSKVEDNDIIKTPVFAEVSGEDMLAWFSGTESDAQIRTIASANGAPELLLDGYDTINQEFSIADNLLTGVRADEDGNTQIFAYALDGAAAAVDVTGISGNAGSPSVAKTENGYSLLFTDKTMDIDGENMLTRTDLCITSVPEQREIAIDAVEYMEEDILPGNETTVSVLVSNNGLAVAPNTSVSITFDGDVIGTVSLPDGLKPGEKQTVDIPVSIPEVIRQNSSFKVQVLVDETPETETALSAGYKDLAISLTEEADTYKVTVRNEGTLTVENAVLTLYDTDEAGNVLQTETVGNIDPDGEKEYIFTREELQSLNASSIFFKVGSGTADLYDFNNMASVYVGDDTLANLIGLRVDAGKTEYVVGDSVLLDDYTVTAVYDDGTEEIVDDYVTNADDLNMNTAGSKSLVITYTKVGQEVHADVPIEVRKKTATISLANKSATYSGKNISIGKATVNNPNGTITYTYYTDKACTVKTTTKYNGAVSKGGAPKYAGAYYVKAKIAEDSIYKSATSKAAVLKINKKAPTIKIKVSSKTVSYSKLKSSTQKFGLGASVTGKGTLYYSIYKYYGSASKYITISKTTGNVSVKRGTPRGTYTFKVKVAAKASTNYTSGSKVFTIKVVVK